MPPSQSSASSSPRDAEPHTDPDPAPQDVALEKQDTPIAQESGNSKDMSKAPVSSPESGERSESDSSPSPEPSGDDEQPAPAGDAPPLPSEPPPGGDDGWDFHWDATNNAYFFHNRLTGASQWDNPRMPVEASSSSGAPGTSTNPPLPPSLPSDKPPAGGYNPAIHGDYDPNAWYAQVDGEDPDEPKDDATQAPGGFGGVTAAFNRFTGQFQTAEDGPDRHTDEAKSRRQMNAFFDVDSAANSHDGRSLKAERSGKKPTKAELKQFKEKRRARKEEKRRAWLRD